MRLVTSTTFTHNIVEELRQELKTVENIHHYWSEELKYRAFGEIKDGNLSYDEWREIYLRHGWEEVPEFMCFKVPKVLTNVLKPDEITHEWANYEKDKAILNIWRVWDNYLRVWRVRINKFESERFDIRVIEMKPKMYFDEAFFILLGLSPTLFGTHYFRPLSMFERTFEIPIISYQDPDGNTCIFDSNLYADESSHSPHLGKLAHMEWYLQEKEEYKLLYSNEKVKCVSGRIFQKKFIKWAIKNEYLFERELKHRNLKISPYGEKFALELWKELIEEEVISGKFEMMWDWNLGWNNLHYLADEIKAMGITPPSHSHFKDIEKYVDVTGMKADLKDQYSDSPEPYEKKLYSIRNKHINKALTRLEKRLEKKG
jgi:hypothetical protein